MAELLLGCGSNRDKKLWLDGTSKVWTKLTTLDFSADHNPDVVHDLEVLPLPFPDNSFDEIHAYDVMEHIGKQGDWRFFFNQWSDIWRMLKPDGVFCGISPHWSSAWAWSDPGHSRIVSAESFIFLDQDNYRQIGQTPMTDYRFCYKADMQLIWHKVADSKQFYYILRAIKPSRINAR